MKEIKDTCYKGTRILLGNEKRDLINSMIDTLKEKDYNEISIPIIQFQDIYEKKVGEHNLHLMFKFEDTKLRKLCLAPEVTAVIQKLASQEFKYQKNVKIFYVQECFRREAPQAGRYRQFTQFGVEIINPTRDYISGVDFTNNVVLTAASLLAKLNYDTIDIKDGKVTLSNFDIKYDVARGLDYYKKGKGFEIECQALGAQKQVCGGGEYEGGVGFAIGIDRILSLKT